MGSPSPGRSGAAAVRRSTFSFLIYERLYSGDPEINARRWFRSGINRECEALVQQLLKRCDQMISSGCTKPSRP
jgi:hypothetical protein